MMFGLTMIACALCVWCIMTYGVQGGQQGTEYTLQACAAFVGGICLVTGIVIIALGFAGRRTGGLHPLTWISIFMSLVMVMALAGYSLLSYRINTGIPLSYKRVNVSGMTTMGSTASEMSEYEQGIVAQGNDYATDVLHIDLSDYAKNNGPHKVDLQDGTQGTTSCPTGTLNVVASSAQVVVTLPNGCWWAFGSDGNFYNITDFVGSSDGLTLDSGNIYVSLMGNDSTKSVVKKRALGTYDRSCGSYGDESGIEDFDDETDTEDGMDTGADSTRTDSPSKTGMWTRPTAKSTTIINIGRASPMMARLRSCQPDCGSILWQRSAAASRCSMRPTTHWAKRERSDHERRQDPGNAGHG